MVQKTAARKPYVKPANRQQKRTRLFLEHLEDRVVPTVLDLTVGTPIQSFVGTDTASPNDAIFRQAVPSLNAGSGNLASFLRVQAGPTEQGYNTDGKLEFNSKGGGFTHALPLSAVQVVSRDGAVYAEFVLDINENSERISLDEFQLFTDTRRDLSGYSLLTEKLAGLTPVYDMDVVQDTIVKLGDLRNPRNTVIFTGANSSGSGVADGFVYVRADILGNYNPTSGWENGNSTFVYLFTKFGTEANNPASIASDGGFEEWAVGKGGPITPPNANPDTNSVTEDTLPNPVSGNVLANDIPTTGLTVSQVNGATVIELTPTTVAGTYGSLTINSDGCYTYLLNNALPAVQGLAAGQTLPDVFTYTARVVEGFTSPSTLTITITGINDSPPVAVNDSKTVAEDSGANTVNVLVNDTDADNLTGPANAGLTVTAITQGANGGTVAITNSGANVSYTPAANYYGPDSFTYQVTDSTGLTSGFATVLITVNAVNDAPVANPDSNAVTEDSPTNPVSGNVLSNDTDADGNTLTVASVNGAAVNVGAAVAGTYGSVTISSNGTYSYTLDNSKATVQALKAGQTVTDVFNYVATDGAASSNSTTLTITITGTNDAPVALAQTITTAEDTAKSGTLVATDIDSLTLTYSIVTGPTKGTLTSFNAATGAYTYTPGANYNGSDSFTFKANDGTVDSNVATVSITVTPVNDAPTAGNDSDTVAEDGSVTTNVVANDNAGPLNESQVLTVTLVTQGTNGSVVNNNDGTVTYTPNANYFGPDSYTYTIADSDGATATATVSITVTSVNDAPSDIVLTGDTIYENASATVEGSFVDPDAGQTHTVTIKWNDGSTPDTVIELAAGVFTFSADHQYLDDKPTNTSSDVYTVTVTITDGLASGTADTLVTVLNVAPTTVMSTGTITLSPGDGFTRPGSFLDPGTLDTWTMTVNYGDSATVYTTNPGSPGTFSIGHTYAAGGSYMVTVTITDDDGGVATKSFLVNVATPPKLATVANQTATKGVDKTIPFSFTGLASTTYNYSINWGDPSATGVGNENVQTGSATTDNNGNGTGDGTFSGTHKYKRKGTYTVFVTITDPLGDSDTIAFVVTVG